MSITITVYVLAALLTLTAFVALAMLWVNASERHKTRGALRQLADYRAQAQALLDALPFPVSVRDSDGVYMASNNASAETLGIDAGIIGKTSLALPARNSSVYELLRESGMEAAKTGRVQSHEISYLDNTNVQRVGMWWDCPVHLDGSTLTGILGVLFDVTHFRDIEREARATEDSLREITRHIPVVMFTLRRDRDRLVKLVFLAGDLSAMFGLDSEDLVETNDPLRDWPLLAHVHPEDQANIRALARRAALHPKVDSLDFRAYAPDGLRWIHLAMAPRSQSDGSVHWTGYLIDTTNINLQNEGLRAARDAAERASKAKADFLATMSHEIRTPMNGVVGMLELLGRTPLDSEQQELLHAVDDSAGVLLQVLNDVLEFSKLEAGSLRLDVAPFDPRTLIDNIVSSMSAHVHGKGLQVRTFFDATLAGQLRGDSVRIRQILMNLLSNAAKFTEHGSIHVALRVVKDDGNSQQLRLTVADTGIGIAEEKQAHLFTPFSQAESWTTRRYGGTGLGLAICRHLLQLMDGAIRLDSKPGTGTTMTVDLRLPVEFRVVEKPDGLAGRHAVIRLDSDQAASALVECLTALEISTERIPPSQPLRIGLSANLLFVEPGDEASQAAVAAQTIVVDERSVNHGGPFRQGDLIHLSANPLKWQSVVRVCVMALEPINPQRHAARLTERVERLGTTNIAPTTRILVAEDHPIGQALARRQLESLGWPCDVVGDGQAAYDALRRGGYAMLLTDCQMPQMDGYTLAAAWRVYETQQGLRRLPIVAMTASALDGEIVRCRSAGMDDYLSKPVQLRQLQEKIERWTSHDIMEGDVASSHGGALAPTTSDSLQTDMRRVMIETGRADIVRIEQALALSDTDAVARHLHRLLGALQLFSDAALLEEGSEWIGALHSGSAGDALIRLPPYVESLRRAIEALELATSDHPPD